MAKLEKSLLPIHKQTNKLTRINKSELRMRRCIYERHEFLTLGLQIWKRLFVLLMDYSDIMIWWTERVR